MEDVKKGEDNRMWKNLYTECTNILLTDIISSDKVSANGRL